MRGDPRWPTSLDELSRPPDRLHVLGELPCFRFSAAVVGTRRASRAACEFAHELSLRLTEEGCTVVSGGASGIDTAAHLGALAGGGPTAVVLATPLSRPYPARNMGLFRQVVASGCLVTEFIDETEDMYPSRFLERNRIIAALAQVVVVVQAPIGSGAMSTAAWARKLGRPVLAVPDSPSNLRAEGCLKLLSEGAAICRSSADVLSIAAPGRRSRAGGQSGRLAKEERIQWLDEDERAIVSALSEGPLSADELCGVSGLCASRVQRVLLTLMLSKDVYEDGCGRYTRATYP